MTYDMRTLFFLSAILISFNVIGAELIPFTKYVDDRPNWFKDGTEIAYAENRCGGLYSAIGVYFDANGTSAEDKDTGQRMKKQGLTLMTRGGILATKYGMTAENSSKRTEALFKSYVDKLMENKRLNNSIFNDDINADLKFCEQLIKVTNVIDKATSGKN